jgi:hypothetical protein
VDNLVSTSLRFLVCLVDGSTHVHRDDRVFRRRGVTGDQLDDGGAIRDSIARHPSQVEILDDQP